MSVTAEVHYETQSTPFHFDDYSGGPLNHGKLLGQRAEYELARPSGTFSITPGCELRLGILHSARTRKLAAYLLIRYPVCFSALTIRQTKNSIDRQKVFVLYLAVARCQAPGKRTPH